MKIIEISIVALVFLLGFFSANLLSMGFLDILENPLGFGSLDNGAAPFDFVEEKQIEIYEDRVVIHIDDASLSRYASTGSMRPVFDQGANGIRIVPDSEDDVHVGDLISYNEGNYLIIHRVIDKGVDDKGVYFIPKGDNSSINDGKIRFKDIKYITVGVIW